MLEYLKEREKEREEKKRERERESKVNMDGTLPFFF